VQKWESGTYMLLASRSGEYGNMGLIDWYFAEVPATSMSPWHGVFVSPRAPFFPVRRQG